MFTKAAFVIVIVASLMLLVKPAITRAMEGLARMDRNWEQFEDLTRDQR
ncbi:hypothetical protein HY480_01460 [Candidatus Uhrbacteria bacterium]|nr:hypothetical protein [Candidatus Uhrbacteria bacterium]